MHHEKQYFSVIKLFNERFVPQGQGKKECLEGIPQCLVFLLDTSTSSWFISLHVLTMISECVREI